jgi:hypothetical protein
LQYLLQLDISRCLRTKDNKMEPSTNDAEDQVRRRAFELWEQRGRPEGYEVELWLQAERELKGRGNSKDISRGISANAASAKSGSGSDGPG